MEKEKSPIAIFVYNRPEHLKLTIRALEKNYYAKDSVVSFFLDGPKKKSDIKKIYIIKNIIEKIKGFKKKKIIFRKKNIGLRKNITLGVSQILKTSKKVIVLEDDMITSKFFLKYMNDGLEMYQNEKKVGCIHGYMYPLKNRKNLKKYFFLKGADCWGWGTWRRSWMHLNLNSKTLLNKLKKNKLINDFDYNNSYKYAEMLEKNVITKKSWAICWYASLYLKNMYTLNSSSSYVKNIGIDGTGSNCIIDYNMNSTFEKKYTKLKKITVKEDIYIKSLISNFMKNNLSQNFFYKILKFFKI